MDPKTKRVVVICATIVICLLICCVCAPVLASVLPHTTP